MNATMGINYEDMEMSYAVDFGRDREPTQNRSRRPAYRRAGSGPARVNGIHHRRSKRWTWGSGRGARMQNLRAFAGCLAVAVAGFASSALGVTIDYATIGNPGNSPNIVSGTNFGGAVATEFKMSTKETTNAQYVAFLNAVGASNTNGVYNGSMGSVASGGIVQAGSPGSYTYSVKPGTAPSGASYGNMPVNFVNWFSAARFVNWMANGQLTGTTGIASMEVGSYTLLNATSGNIIPRNVGATVFLPSADEWYKAAFYNGSAYTTWQTNSNTTPTATLTFSTANAANVASVTASPVAVGSYTNSSVSAYGMYDMLGNVTEITDTANGASAAQFRALGGGFGASVSSWNSTANAIFQSSTFSNQSYGFRVAAVPEPGTIALAITGMLGMVGMGWLKRRERQAMLLAAAEVVAV